MDKLDQVFGFIESAYVDTPDQEELVEGAIAEVLEKLDPYSSYIASKDLAHANEQLEGNFEGIGVEFNIISDTVTIVRVIAGGPSERLGLLPGDKIVKVEKKIIAGVGFTNADVIRNLKGPKGSEVSIEIKRSSQADLLSFKITREEIKIKSVPAVYMVNENTGYIKVNRFAATTAEDFHNGILELKENGAEQLIVDLRENPGGYLGAASQMINEFLPNGQLITYTQGRARQRDEFKAKGDGIFIKGKLCVLINENSASASEIFSGAIQDLDRGIIIGRRSHGKGLVQEPIQLDDGSQIRLTVARYYTPSGRCIQRPYDMTKENGASDDLVKKFKTSNGRTVLEGGGIIPDRQVDIDSIYYDKVFQNLLRKGVVHELAMDYHLNNRVELKEKYPNYKAFYNSFGWPKSIRDTVMNVVEELKSKAKDASTKLETKYVEDQFKLSIARYLYGDEAFYYILNSQEEAVSEAVSILNTSEYTNMLETTKDAE